MGIVPVTRTIYRGLERANRRQWMNHANCQERWAGGLEEYSKGFLSIYIGSIDIDSKRKELRALRASRMRYATSHVCLGIRDNIPPFRRVVLNTLLVASSHASRSEIVGGTAHRSLVVYAPGIL